MKTNNESGKCVTEFYLRSERESRMFAQLRLLVMDLRETRSVIGAIAVFLIGGVLSTLTGCDSRKSMEPISITQCFQKIGEPFDRKKEEFFLDTERQCYGQRWSIPKAFYSHKHVSYGPVTESLFIEVGHPGLTPGAFIPRDKIVRLFNEVEIMPLFTGDFARRVREIKDSMQLVGGPTPTDRVLFGMRVYERTKIGRSDYGSVYLFPDGNAQLFAQCLTRPGTTIDQKFPHSGCKIVGNVDDRVMVEYHIEYAEMPNIARHNDEMVMLLRSFMIRTKTEEDKK